MFMSTRTLRPYQIDAENQILDNFKNGIKKVLLHLPTGSGKTTVFSDILKKVEKKGNKGIVVVHGRKLVDQASERLTREDVNHGVLMANHSLYRPNAPIQACSIDTLIARNLRPEADIVIIDEAHQACSPSYHDFAKDYPDAFFLPVTATPYQEKSMRHIADTIVNPITMEELILQGHLVPPRYFGPHVPDLKGIRKNGGPDGDYNNSQLADYMSNNQLVGDIVTQWKRLGDNRPSVCFATSINHSKLIVKSFNERGINFAHMDAHTHEDKRKELIYQLETGKIHGISNVGILITGVDIPCLGTIILARPTLSTNLYIQMCGRGTRPFYGKDDFLILDHAGNVSKHGYITREREANLDHQKIDFDKVPQCSVCKNCFAVFEGNTCHNCGLKRKIVNKKRNMVKIDGELKEIDANSPEIKAMVRLNELKKIRKQKGYKRGWLYHRLVLEFGEELASKLVPQKVKPWWVK